MLLFWSFSFASVVYDPDYVIVQYAWSSDFSTYGLSDEISYIDSSIVDPFYLIPVDSFGSVENAITVLQNDPQVAYVQPNYIYTLGYYPNDQYFNLQWSLLNTGQTVQSVAGTSGVDISWDDAMSIFSGVDDVSTTGTLVAVIDNGILTSHPDLTGRIWDGTNCLSYLWMPLWSCQWGYDFYSSDTDPSPDINSSLSSQNWHGTFVGWLIAANPNNSIWIAGVNPRAKLMALRVGTGKTFSTTTLLQAIDFAWYNGAKIINASFGTTSNDGLVRSAFEAFDGLVIAAAGNGWLDQVGDQHLSWSYNVYPCDYDFDHILCVTATNQDDIVTWFADYGTAYVDIAAPGFNMVSTAFSDGNSGYLAQVDGTSMSVPLVAGLASLVWSMTPSLSPLAVKSAILSYGDFIGDLSTFVATSSRINVYKTLDAFILDGSIELSDSILVDDTFDITLSASKSWSTYVIDGTWLSTTYTGILSGLTDTISAVVSTGDGEKFFTVTFVTGLAEISFATSVVIDISTPVVVLNSHNGSGDTVLSEFSLAGTFSDGYAVQSLVVNNISYTGCNYSQSLASCLFTIPLSFWSSGLQYVYYTGLDWGGNITTGVWYFTVELIDTDPDNISVPSYTGLDKSTFVITPVYTITGINTGVTLSMINGSCRINGWWYLSTTRTIYAGQTLQCALTASSSYSTTVSMTINIGSDSYVYSLTTKEQPAGARSGWGGGWGGWWSSTRIKDTCIGEDTSGSLYDTYCTAQDRTVWLAVTRIDRKWKDWTPSRIQASLDVIVRLNNIVQLRVDVSSVLKQVFDKIVDALVVKYSS